MYKIKFLLPFKVNAARRLSCLGGGLCFIECCLFLGLCFHIYSRFTEVQTKQTRLNNRWKMFLCWPQLLTPYSGESKKSNVYNGAL